MGVAPFNPDFPEVGMVEHRTPPVRAVRTQTLAQGSAEAPQSGSDLIHPRTHQLLPELLCLIPVEVPPGLQKRRGSIRHCSAHIHEHHRVSQPGFLVTVKATHPAAITRQPFSSKNCPHRHTCTRNCGRSQQHHCKIEVSRGKL